MKRKERSQKIRKYLKTNTLFVIIATVLIALYFFGDISEKKKNTKSVQPSTQFSESTEEKSEELPKLKFFMSDVIVLLVGGGFCLYKIAQEKRKAKEEM